MIQFTTITTAEQLGQTLAQYGVDTDPIESAASVVSAFWFDEDGKHLPIARLLRGIPTNDIILAKHAAQLTLHWQNPQDFWFHRIHTPLSGDPVPSDLHRWIQPVIFPHAIVSEPIRSVREKVLRTLRMPVSSFNFLDILKWCHVDTDPLVPLQTAPYNAWKRLWSAGAEPVAQYVRGRANHPVILVARADYLCYYSYHSPLDQWHLESEFQILDTTTTADIYAWIQRHYAPPSH